MKKLPEHYRMTIATIDRQHYPVYTFDTPNDKPTIASMRWDYSIPYAQGRTPTYGKVSFRTRKEALAFCHREHEHPALQVKWAYLVASSELYAERNAWYLEELGDYASSDLFVGRIGDLAYARIKLWDGTDLEVEGETVDEVYVKLYEAVCSYAEQRHISFSLPVHAESVCVGGMS